MSVNIGSHQWPVTKPASKGRRATRPDGCNYWTHNEKEFRGSNQEYFDHNAFYVGYNVAIVFHSATKAVKGVWRLDPRKNFTLAFSIMPENAPLQTLKLHF